ncbi:MAG: sulfurtransferase [Pseudomonadota bacterium]
MKNQSPGLHDVTVTPEWLAERLNSEKVVAVDVSWYQAHESRNPSEEFLAEHIWGAIHIPLEALSDSSSSLPHTLPDIETLCATLGRYGIDNETTVVSYDATGFRTSPRLWWLLQWAGHQRVAILDGGLPAWKAAGFALESGVTPRSAVTFVARSGGHMPTATADDVVVALGDLDVQVVDARPRERFDGTSPEPRPGLRSGHIPGSASAELKCFVNPVTNRLLSRDAIGRQFEELGIDFDRNLVTTCGSGVAATGLIAILQTLGVAATLYDGSWCEWGSRPDLPVRQTDPR